MGIITKIEDPTEDGKIADPVPKKIGIITLEDIVEEVLQEEIEDERETQAMKGERKKLRQKLALMFSDRHAQSILNREELIAVREYLEIELPPFGRDVLTLDSLQKLVEESEIIDIESDINPFSHKASENLIRGTNSMRAEDYNHNTDASQNLDNSGTQTTTGQMQFQKFLTHIMKENEHKDKKKKSKKEGPKTIDKITPGVSEIGTIIEGDQSEVRKQVRFNKTEMEKKPEEENVF